MSLRLRGLALLGALTIVASACGGSATPAPSAAPVSAPIAAPSSAASAAPSAAAAASADFKMGLDAEPTYFSPAFTDQPTGFIVGLMYSGMYRANNKLDVVPDMATALPTVSADGLTWTVTLKPGIKWQNGDDFTSADVKFTFDFAASKNCTFTPSFCSDIQSNLASVAAPDPQTVVFTLKNKLAPFLITDLTAYIVPQKAVMASFATFQAAAGKADATAVAALDDKISKATGDKACDGSATQPATCDYATYVTDLETILQSGGIPLGAGVLNKAIYLKPDGSPDPTGYGQALATALSDLNRTLKATQTDQVAAAFRLLDFQQKPVGTGPYKFVSYAAGQTVQLAANPTYYAGTVGPPNFFAPIIKDAASESSALQKGDINWQYAVVSDALATLKNDPNLQLVSFADFGYYFIAFNLRAPHIYSDSNLRQAFSMCIDHDATVAKATDSNGIPVYANVPPASWAFDTNVPKYTLDVKGAQALIEKSGWTLGSDKIYAKAGKRLSTTLYVRSGKPQRVSFAQLAADQLKTCGIEIKVVPADFSTVLLPLLSFPNNFDTYLGGWSTALDPDDSSIFGCDQITTKASPDSNNFVGWCNKAADALLTQGRQETDKAKRTAIYAQFQAAVHNDVPYYFLWADAANAGLTKSVTAGTNTVVTDGTLDVKSPLYFWNQDTWTIKAQ
jgi:ABC-type transport system substrate-binding protein